MDRLRLRRMEGISGGRLTGQGYRKMPDRILCDVVDAENGRVVGVLWYKAAAAHPLFPPSDIFLCE